MGRLDSLLGEFSIYCATVNKQALPLIVNVVSLIIVSLGALALLSGISAALTTGVISSRLQSNAAASAPL